MRRVSREALASRAVNPRFPYGEKKVRGVGIGGWLVIEDFITPSIYEEADDNRVIDEWSFGKYTPQKKAERIMRDHIDSFITEDDFKEIADLGLNHVRVPFPYWGIKTYPGDPYIKVNQYAKLKEAAQWADNHGLKMMIELHTVPGGANPYDHGGHTNHSNWLDSDRDQGRTLDILGELASEFSKSKYSAVTAISLVNEPVGDRGEIFDFYKKGYHAVRDSEKSGTDLLVVIGDAFQNPAENDYWHNKFQPPNYQGVMVDTHIYRLFDPDSIALTQDQRISYYCSMKSGIASANGHLWELVGEWSPTFTDCAPHLNGRFQGSRYAGTFPGSTRRGSCDSKTGNANSFSDGYKALLKRNWEVQADVYEAGVGWIMWTWKTQHHTADDWSYRAGVANGWIPRDPTDRSQHC
ncbi:glucan 1,3-beta-glucosidase [Malassezia sp. CBS 17886]|nr:glucan 1,3-beta-glucosidase [Malassezia sp. CBS 17886]